MGLFTPKNRGRLIHQFDLYTGKYGRELGFQLTSALEDLLAVKLSQEARGGGYYHIVWVGVCRWVCQSPTLH